MKINRTWLYIYLKLGKQLGRVVKNCKACSPALVQVNLPYPFYLKSHSYQISRSKVYSSKYFIQGIVLISNVSSWMIDDYHLWTPLTKHIVNDTLFHTLETFANSGSLSHSTLIHLFLIFKTEEQFIWLKDEKSSENEARFATNGTQKTVVLKILYQIVPWNSKFGPVLDINVSGIP